MKIKMTGGTIKTRRGVRQRRIRRFEAILIILLLIYTILPVVMGNERGKGKGKGKGKDKGDSENFLTLEFDYLESDLMSGLPIQNLYYEILGQDGTTVLATGYTDDEGKAYYYMEGLDWVYVSLIYNGVVDGAQYNVSDYKYFGFRAPEFSGIVYSIDDIPLPEFTSIDLLTYDGSNWNTLYTFTVGADGVYNIFVPTNAEWSINPANLTFTTDQFTTLLLNPSVDLFHYSKEFIVSIKISKGTFLFVFLIIVRFLLPLLSYLD